MGSQTGWSAGKIIGVVVLVLVAIGAVCVGGVFLAAKKVADEVDANPQLRTGVAVARMAVQIATRNGSGTQFSVDTSDPDGMVILIGLAGELTPERVQSAQDHAWGAWCELMARGAPPLGGIRIAQATGGAIVVKDEEGLLATAAELESRTGIPAPPLEPALADFKLEDHEIPDAGDLPDPGGADESR